MLEPRAVREHLVQRVRHVARLGLVVRQEEVVALVRAQRRAAVAREAQRLVDARGRAGGGRREEGVAQDLREGGGAVLRPGLRAPEHQVARVLRGQKDRNSALRCARARSLCVKGAAASPL